jgi:hypothetical protein
VESGDADLLALGGDVLGGKHGGVGLSRASASGSGERKQRITEQHSWGAETMGAQRCRLTEVSSRSALTFIPPVTREMVSLPERSVMWTKVSLNLVE